MGKSLTTKGKVLILGELYLVIKYAYLVLEITWPLALGHDGHPD